MGRFLHSGDNRLVGTCLVFSSEGYPGVYRNLVSVSGFGLRFTVNQVHVSSYGLQFTWCKLDFRYAQISICEFIMYTT